MKIKEIEGKKKRNLLSKEKIREIVSRNAERHGSPDENILLITDVIGQLPPAKAGGLHSARPEPKQFNSTHKPEGTPFLGIWQFHGGRQGG